MTTMPPTTADDLLLRREQLKEKGLTIGADELCRDVPEEIRSEVMTRLALIESAERAFELAWDQSDDDCSVPFIPAGRPGRYDAPRIEAEGGMGVLCIAEDVELGRPVAYKVMKPGFGQETLARERFFHEARITSKLNHPGVVPVYGQVIDDTGQPAYASAFVTGRSLAWQIERFQSIRLDDRPARKKMLDQLLKTFVETCEIVAYSHTQKIVHGDIKPLNILKDEGNSTRLVDWGLARIVSDEEESIDENFDVRPGTWPFVSSYDRPATYASDIYALGLTLAMIIAKPESSISSTLRPSADVPPSLWAVALKAMSPDRASRYATASALADDILSVLDDRAIAPYLDPISTRLRRWVSSHGQFVTFLGAFLVIAATAGPIVGARENRLRLKAEAERNNAVQLSREMLRQAEHIGKLQATLPGSKAMLQRAVQLLEQLGGDGGPASDELGPALASYYQAGRTYQNLGQLEEAAGCFQKVIDRATKYARNHPDDTINVNRWAAALRDWGVVRFLQGRTAEASEAWAEGIQLIVPVAPRAPAYRLTHARLLYAVGNQLMLANDQAGAQARFEDSRVLLTELAEQEQDEMPTLKALADVYHNIGLSLYYQSIPDGRNIIDPDRLVTSKVANLESLRLRRKLQSLEPGNPDYLADIAASLNKLGNLAQAQGASTENEAIEHYRQASRLLEALVIAFPGAPLLRRDLAQVYSNSNVVLARQNRIEEATNAAKLAVELLERVVADQPDAANSHVDLGVALIQQAQTLERGGGDLNGSNEAKYKAAIAMARASSMIRESSQSDSLASQSLSLLNDLKSKGFFQDRERANQLANEPAFSFNTIFREIRRP